MSGITPVGVNISSSSNQQQQEHSRTESGSSLAAASSNTNKPTTTTSNNIVVADTTTSSQLLNASGFGSGSGSLISFHIPDTPESLLTMAKMAELCERWDEMQVCMKKLAKLSAAEEEFGSEERHLLHVAYRNCVLIRRASWRVAKSVEQKAELDYQVESTPERQSSLRVAQEFRVQLETEITDICTDLIVLVENVMFPHAIGDDAKMFLFKLAGDFYRYLAEVNPSGTFNAAVSLYAATKPAATGGLSSSSQQGNASGAFTRDSSSTTTPVTAALLSHHHHGHHGGHHGAQQAQQQQDEYWVLAQEAYARATELASSLRPSHPMRLSIALNLAVFYYETMRSTDKALHLARETFSAAISDEVGQETVLESEANEAGAILQLLQENLFFWTQPTDAVTSD